MLANNQCANKSKGDKRELDFDFVFEQLLNISKDSSAPHDSRSLKTFVPKSKDKGKSHSNKTCLYYSKLGHSDGNYYYKHPKKTSDTF